MDGGIRRSWESRICWALKSVLLLTKTTYFSSAEKMGNGKMQMQKWIHNSTTAAKQTNKKKKVGWTERNIWHALELKYFGIKIMF